MKLHQIIWPTVFSPTQSICPKSIRWKFFLVRSHCLFICRPLTNRRRESNPGRLGRKRDRFLCAMPSPLLEAFSNRLATNQLDRNEKKLIFFDIDNLSHGDRKIRNRFVHWKSGAMNFVVCTFWPSIRSLDTEKMNLPWPVGGSTIVELTVNLIKEQED